MSKKNSKNMTKSATAFQITLNEPEFLDDVKKYIKSIKHYSYSMAVSEKAPKTGKKHIHIYIQYSRSVRLSINKLMGAHIEKCYGTAQENIVYISKHLNDGTGVKLWEDGSYEEKGKKGGKTIRDLKNMTKEERNDLPMPYYNIVEKINKQEDCRLKVSDFRKKVKVYYVHGPSGIGKTNWCLDKMMELGIEYFSDVKFHGGFWMGISENTTCALYDDFRDGHMKPSEFINFIDYNVHNLNVKGNFIKNKFETIFITSVQNPNDLWREFREKNPEDTLTQWIRRMEIIHLGKEEEEVKKFEKIVEEKKEEWEAFYHGSPDPLNNESQCYDPFDLENYK